MDHSVQQTPQHLFATSAISLYSTEKLQRPASRRRIIKNRQNWRRNFRSSQFLNGSFLRIETSQNRLPGQFYTILVVLQQIRITSSFNAKFDAAPEPPLRLNASPQRLETTSINSAAHCRQDWVVIDIFNSARSPTGLQGLLRAEMTGKKGEPLTFLPFKNHPL